jgi:FtsP/CotA-like multicopper oxidase with cupredoxin domain
MTTTRRRLLSRAALLAGGAALGSRIARADGPPAGADVLAAPPSGASNPTPPGAISRKLGYRPVVTPNLPHLPWRMRDGVKEFHLIAQKVKREFAPGMIVNCWGYNGSCHGPTIECVEGDRVRIYVTNELPERTSVHWHGIFLPCGMDGVSGLNQPHIEPGETYVYEFTLRQHGVFMYHPHSDEMVQMALGMMGFFIVHPRVPERPRIDRHFAFLLQEWFIEPGTATPNPMIMLDFNLFSLNARVWPGTTPLVVKTGDRVRVSFGNLSMDSHPIHLHGYAFEEVGTDGGVVPKSARRPETTVSVPVGSTRTVEFVADVPGDWAFHCHKSHHTMNAMGHDIPNMIGVEGSKGAESKIRKHLPRYMTMGERGMGGMHDMGLPRNTLPMMAGDGPFGPIEMGGMFTVLKVRDRLKSYDEDPGWYEYPEGTKTRKVERPKDL